MRHMPFVMRAECDGHCAFVVLFVVVGRRLFVCIQEMGGYWQQYIRAVSIMDD